MNNYKIDNDTVVYDAPASTAVDVGDFLYYDTSGETILPASSQADAGTEALNQRTFALNFAGIALDKRIALQTTAGTCNVATNLVAYVTAASDDYDVGDYLAVDEASSGTALEDQKVVKVTEPSLAIGVCVKSTGASSTNVWGYFPAKRNFGSALLVPSLGGSQVTRSDTATLAGTRTLTVESAPIQVLDPDGSDRTVTLPDVAAAKGYVFHIVNTANGAGEDLNVKNAGATAIGTVTPTQAGMFYSDGTTWFGLRGQTIIPQASGDQADQGTMTTIGANTGTSGAGLSLIGDTTMINQAAALMNDLAALQEDIAALDVLLTAIRSALIEAGIIKGAA
jgi:hypothetical protein